MGILTRFVRELLNRMARAVRGGPAPPTQSTSVTDVWEDNLHEAFAEIRDMVEAYPYIAMNTEFPGVIARPTGSFKSTSDYHFQTLRANCDLLKVVQVGLTFTDGSGSPPPWSPSWVYHFKFVLGEDMYAQDTVDGLARSGVNFKAHEENGVDPHTFAELLMSSGCVLLDSVTWVSFHGGYDFGYLLSLLTCAPLPSHEDAFFDILSLYFPHLVDGKVLANELGKKRGSLYDLADDLGLARPPPLNDSLLVSNLYWALAGLAGDKKKGKDSKPASLAGKKNSSSSSSSSSSSAHNDQTLLERVNGRLYGITTYSQRVADKAKRAASSSSAPTASATSSPSSSRHFHNNNRTPSRSRR